MMNDESRRPPQRKSRQRSRHPWCCGRCAKKLVVVVWLPQYQPEVTVHEYQPGMVLSPSLPECPNCGLDFRGLTVAEVDSKLEDPGAWS